MVRQEMKTTLTLERRKNWDGDPCIAPFINGFNTGDIPEKEWTLAVARSVQRAYEVGYAEALRRVQELRLSSGGEWEEVK